MSAPHISRRQFLAGGLGFLAVGGFGAMEVMHHPLVLHRLGLEGSPDKHFPDAHVRIETGTMNSRFMKDPVQWMYSLPTTTPTATVFCLHGRGGSYRDPFDVLRLQDIAEALHLPLAFAAAQSGENSYWHQRSDGTDAMAMLVDEFVPFVESRTQTSKRAVYGWSMGGFGALLAAEMHPSTFSAVAALSPAIWPRFNQAVAGAFDNAMDFRSHDVFGMRSLLSNTPVRIACGDGDPFRSFDEQFAGGLRTVETDFGKGFHDAPYWRSVSPSMLLFLNKHL
jgi:pimeloyl-ACP methyl ester carboxylesterase